MHLLVVYPYKLYVASLSRWEVDLLGDRQLISKGEQLMMVDHTTVGAIL